MHADILASSARSSAICSRDTRIDCDSDVWWPRKGAYAMHCSLAFGSIGACGKLVGMPSHHHTVAIVARDIRRSTNGVRRKISSVSRGKDHRSAGMLPRPRSNEKSASVGMDVKCESCLIDRTQKLVALSAEPRSTSRTTIL
jgi:hypothetical protein